MSRWFAKKAVLLLIFLIALAPFVVSCAAGTPEAEVPLRELPKSSAELLSMARANYGDPTPFDFGADDRGSKDAQAAFEKLAGGKVVHEPALDLVAAVLGRAYYEAPGRSPASSLIQWIYWKCGSLSVPGPGAVLVAESGLEAAFEPHLKQALDALPPGSQMQTTYGLVRLTVPGGTFQAMAIGYRALDMGTVPKKFAPGAKLQIAGTLQSGFSDPMAYIETTGAEPAEIPLPVTESKVSAAVDLPAKPGRYFIQIRGAEPPRAPDAPPWYRNFIWAPIFVGVDEPGVPDEIIRNPPKNHPDKSAWLFQILNAYNAERAKVGRAPLAFVREASVIAQAQSDQRAALTRDPPPDLGLSQRLAEAGLPPRDLMNSAGWLEYVSEYITIRLLQPWTRYRILKENVSVLALGMAQRPGSTRTEMLVTEYVFEPIRVDPAKDGERMLAEIEAIETKAGRKPPERAAALSADAQSIAESICAGGAMPKTGAEVWALVKSRDPELHHRMASSTAGYDIAQNDLVALAAPLSEGVEYTKMGLGVCQGKVDGNPHVMFALLLLMGP